MGMYNRYIPQPDGTYRRNRMAEVSAQPPKAPPPRYEPSSPLKQPASIQEVSAPPIVPGSGITGFLRQLLPKDFDTADLIIVLLLLLMAGDNEKERSTALLTMALYFIM